MYPWRTSWCLGYLTELESHGHITTLTASVTVPSDGVSSEWGITHNTPLAKNFTCCEGCSRETIVSNTSSPTVASIRGVRISCKHFSSLFPDPALLLVIAEEFILLASTRDNLLPIRLVLIPKLNPYAMYLYTEVLVPMPRLLCISILYRSTHSSDYS